MMDGRAFLDVARTVVAQANEASWRTAAGRAYYALFSEARFALRNWGFLPAPRDPLHGFVRLRFQFASDAVLKRVGEALEKLGRLRNEADYEIEQPGRFASPARVLVAIRDAEQAIQQLQQIDTDAPRRAAAVADMRARWP